jgi:GntR family transcriptional regulator/MocR family aminotransferase
MELHLVIESRKDLTGQVYRQLREAIRSGRLSHGEQLPPSRVLAGQLGVSRKTISEAYAKLTHDRLMAGQVGVGSFVIGKAEPSFTYRSAADLASAAVVKHWDSLATPLLRRSPAGQSRYEFIGGATSKSGFPLDQWRRSMLWALRKGVPDSGRYGEAAGIPQLQQAIAKHASFSRGVRCSASDIVVTCGAQQALDLIARVLIEPGCIVAVEDPGYPPARSLFACQGANVIGVPVDAEGIVVDQIPAGVRLIYVTPSHQFPLGMPMSRARRQALIERALEIGAIIIEDDYDSAFRHEGRPVDCLQSMDTHGIVAYVGTFSKVLLPEMRLGYLIAPPAILNAVVTAKHLTDGHVGTTMQWALAHFIEEGLLAKHIRRSLAIYGARRTRILERLRGDLSEWFEPLPSTSGCHVAALLKKPLDLALLITLARRVEVGLYRLDPFYVDSPPAAGLLFGFGAIELLDIDTAMDRVASILSELG